MMPEKSSDRLYERAWGLFFVAALSAACLLIAAPFLAATLWAIVLAVSFWPIYRRLRNMLGGRRGLAAFLVSLLLMVTLLVPVVGLAVSAANHVPTVMEWIDTVAKNGLPPPPLEVATWPIIGDRLYGAWIAASVEGTEIFVRFQKQIKATIAWLFSQGGTLGLGILEFALAIVITGILLVKAEIARAMVNAFAAKIGGDGAVELLQVVGRTIRAVSNGVVGTAFLQGVLSAFGFAISGVPVPVLLGFLSFLLAVMQVGPAPVWIPAALWLWLSGQAEWAAFLAAWGLFAVNSIDNFVRPYLISRGSHLPLLLIFAGVLGGMLAWGLIGIFLGATLLAVGYRLLISWIERPAGPSADEPEAQGPTTR
jgi:predicted PurR-regulated permease PerM